MQSNLQVIIITFFQNYTATFARKCSFGPVSKGQQESPTFLQDRCRSS
jgi:hypothetical protein